MSSNCTQNFSRQLVDHIMLQMDERYAYGDDWYTKLDFKSNRIVTHRKAQLHYTAYDVSRVRDIVRPHFFYSKSGCVRRGHVSKTTVMVAASDEDRRIDGHPFWYARVLGIFTVAVRLRSSQGTLSGEQPAPYRSIDMFWVRWFGRDLDGAGSWENRRLDRLSYLPDDHEPGSYGFVNPDDVIRSCLLTPAFRYQKSGELSASKTDVLHVFNHGWNKFYANR